MEESEIKAIKLILAVLALGLLVAVGAAFEGHDGSSHGKPSHGHHDFGGFHDWLSPGAYYYYSYSYYPTYTYTYPAYYYPAYYYPAYYYQTYTPVYTAPVVTTPVVYDPWWAVNVYGLGATTYYYTSSWSWSSYHGGYYFR